MDFDIDIDDAQKKILEQIHLLSLNQLTKWKCLHTKVVHCF